MLPETVQFSIAADVYVAANPPIAEERYGDAFAGTITCRIWTAKQRMITVPTKTARLLEGEGAADASGSPISSWDFALALVFFETLGQDLPPWLTGEAAGTVKGISAIRHAHARALEEIERGKKPSAPVGEPSSPTT